MGGQRLFVSFFFFQAEDGIRDVAVTGVQTCALPISQALLVDTDFLIATAREHVGAEALSQTVERLAQRGARVLLVELWPEQSEQRVSAVEAGGRRSGGGRQEGE